MNSFSHLIRYVNLNNYSSGLLKIFEELEDYIYCSLREYFLTNKESRISDPKYLLNLFRSHQKLKKFILDRAEYQKMLEIAKHAN